MRSGRVAGWPVCSGADRSMKALASWPSRSCATPGNLLSGRTPSIADGPAAAHIEHDGQVHESCGGRGVGDIGPYRRSGASASKRRSTRSGAVGVPARGMRPLAPADPGQPCLAHHPSPPLGTLTDGIVDLSSHRGRCPLQRRYSTLRAWRELLLLFRTRCAIHHHCIWSASVHAPLMVRRCSRRGHVPRLLMVGRAPTTAPGAVGGAAA